MYIPSITLTAKIFKVMCSHLNLNIVVDHFNVKEMQINPFFLVHHLLFICYIYILALQHIGQPTWSAIAPRCEKSGALI